MRSFLSLVVATFVFLTQSVAGTVEGVCNITPVPNYCEYGVGNLDVSKGLSLYINAAKEDAVRLEAAASTLGVNIKGVKRPAKRNYLNLSIVDREELAHIKESKNIEEGYELTIGCRGVDIKATTAAGLYYGLQTLKQISKSSDGRLPQLTICDAPRFEYRGIMVDVSRHFRTKEFLMRQMDIMAEHKLNRLHLHLTDAAGWRIEVESYPRLTSYTAWRAYPDWKSWWNTDRGYLDEGAEGAYGGYLTKEDARELVKYAADRYITLVPEIEMPGHSEEVIAAYPELGCSHKPAGQGDLCIGKEATFEMMQAILDEVIEIFPSEYIHIGGDEATKSSWVECEDCQRRMKEEGLESVDELQSYMIHRIEKYLNERGRQIIGWDEILQGGLAPNATVMSWRGEEGGLTAAAAGHQVVMSPHDYCYINAPQDAPYSQSESLGGYLPLVKVYNYDPAPKSMEQSVQDYIIGIQANLWAEYIVTDDNYEYMLWPRALAIAETGWSYAERKDYDSFRGRAIEIVDELLERGYTVFDLKNEIGDRPESLQPVEHKALGKPVEYLYPSYYNLLSILRGVVVGWIEILHRLT